MRGSAISVLQVRDCEDGGPTIENSLQPTDELHPCLTDVSIASVSGSSRGQTLACRPLSLRSFVLDAQRGAALAMGIRTAR